MDIVEHLAEHNREATHETSTTKAQLADVCVEKLQGLLSKGSWQDQIEHPMDANQSVMLADLFAEWIEDWKADTREIAIVVIDAHSGENDPLMRLVSEFTGWYKAMLLSD